MLMAKIVDNVIVEYIDTDKPENFPDFIEIPEHVPSNADLRYYHEDWTPKNKDELIADGLDVSQDHDTYNPDPSYTARSQRDALLAELDMIVTNPLRWSTFDDTQKQALAEYRQALLDVPQQDGFPENINWPVKPEVI